MIVVPDFNLGEVAQTISIAEFSAAVGYVTIL
jgi:hypothetical protein